MPPTGSFGGWFGFSPFNGVFLSFFFFFFFFFFGKLDVYIKKRRIHRGRNLKDQKDPGAYPGANQKANKRLAQQPIFRDVPIHTSHPVSVISSILLPSKNFGFNHVFNTLHNGV